MVLVVLEEGAVEISTGTPLKFIFVYTSETRYRKIPFCDHIVSPVVSLTDLIFTMAYDGATGTFRYFHLDEETPIQRQIEEFVTDGKEYEGRLTLPLLSDYIFDECGLREYLGYLDTVDKLANGGVPMDELIESPLNQILETNYVKIIGMDGARVSIIDKPRGHPLSEIALWL